MTSGNGYFQISGAIKAGAYWVGRVNVTTNQGIFQQIGRITGVLIYYRNPETGAELFTQGPYEVLACV